MEYDLEKQHDKGKLHAMERIQQLLDEDTFIEIGSRVHHSSSSFGLDKKILPYDGVITGIGKIGGKEVALYSQDFTVMGGTVGTMHGKKIAHIIQLAIDSRCPLIGINDSGGARIQEGVSSLAGYGDIFRLNTLASGYIPQISIIVGPCAGGAVYSPGITDFVFMVESISHMFVTGPNVIKKVLYQDIDKDSLGGAVLHSQKSGVCHFAEKTEEECFSHVRDLLSYLPQAWDADQKFRAPEGPGESYHPHFPILPDNAKTSYDVRDIIAHVVDEGSFLEVSKNFAKNMVIGFARSEGKTVGIIANQTKYLAGVIDCDASIKASRFIRFCDAFNIPLVTFVDVPGFLPGADQEKQGIIRHGAKLLFAYSESTVPKITFILRKAYGGAYIAMCSKHLGADFVFAWETAEIAVMGADGAVDILFSRELREAQHPVDLKKELEDYYSKEFLNPDLAAKLGVVDEVIAPEDTQRMLIFALNMLKGKKVPVPVKKHGNIPL